MTSTYGHHDDPGRDFAAEVEALRASYAGEPKGRAARDLLRRVERAQARPVGGDGAILVAKYDLAAIAASLVAGEPDLAMPAATVVAEVEGLARLLARQRGYAVPPGHVFREAGPGDPRSAGLWRDAVEIHEHLRASRVAEAVAEVDGTDARG